MYRALAVCPTSSLDDTVGVIVKNRSAIGEGQGIARRGSWHKPKT